MNTNVKRLMNQPGSVQNNLINVPVFKEKQIIIGI